MTTRRFYAPASSFSDGTVTLDADEARHLRDVLRLTAGGEVNVFDGEGREFHCRIESAGKKDAVLSVLGTAEPSAPESPLHLTLAACQLPGEKFDLVVQKAVELGVRHLVPLESARTEVRASGGERRMLRWQKIAVGATKQCGRATLMTVEPPVKFTEYAARVFDGPVYFFSERDGGPFPEAGQDKKITAFLGPKGGWDDAELAAARDRGFNVITFGGRILRAETAAIAVSTLLQHKYGDLR